MVFVRQMRNDHPYTNLDADTIKTWEADMVRISPNGQINLFIGGHLVERIIPSIDFRIGDWPQIESA